MKHIIKNLILFLLVFMTSGAVFSFKAYAYDPCVHLTVFYSEGITPSENDMFELTYRFRDEADTATITFDASLLYGQKGKILLEPASYEIVGAKYLGDNKIIKSEGFAVTTAFTVMPDNKRYAEIVLAIGGEEGDKLCDNYTDVLVNIRNVYYSSFDEYYIQNDIKEGKASDNTSSGSQSQSSSSEGNNEKPRLERPKTERPEHNDEKNETEIKESESKNTGSEKPYTRQSSFMTRGLPILIVFIIGLAVIFILSKKHIIR